jgi:hypothetical protein
MTTPSGKGAHFRSAPYLGTLAALEEASDRDSKT